MYVLRLTKLFDQFDCFLDASDYQLKDCKNGDAI